MGTNSKDTPAVRAMRARMAAYTLHSQRDSKEHTAPAREGFKARFAREVDPHGVLTEAERQRRAECALKSHMTRLALASAKARARRAGDGRHG